MFWRSRRDRARVSDFRFSNKGYTLSDEILSEYKSVKRLYRRAKQRLSSYEKKHNDPSSKCISVILCCLELYEQSEKLLGDLLTEILKPNTDIERKKAVFVLLDKMAKMFYLFDICRFNKVLVFHDFAVTKQKNLTCLGESDALRLTSFTAISMPMAHLFISSFTSNNLELHVPTILFKRSLIHLDKEKKKALRFICDVLCNTDMKYLAMYCCISYGRFFGNDDFEHFVESLDAQQVSYYEAALMLN